MLNAFYAIYMKYCSENEFLSIKQDFRYALCWIDEALHMQ